MAGLSFNKIKPSIGRDSHVLNGKIGMFLCQEFLQFHYCRVFSAKGKAN